LDTLFRLLREYMLAAVSIGRLLELGDAVAADVDTAGVDLAGRE
jgi:hypothetical protein